MSPEQEAKEADAPEIVCADYAFRILPWEQALAMIRALEFARINLCMNEARSHIRPELGLEDPVALRERVVAEVQAAGLGVAQVHVTPEMETVGINSPDEPARRHAERLVEIAIDVAAATGADGVTAIPGYFWPQESPATSLARSIEATKRLANRAGEQGVELSIEAHFGSLIPTPGEALGFALATDVPLTLDPGHFVFQGIAPEELDPLLPYVGFVHARGARTGRIQAPMRENIVDYGKLATELQTLGFCGGISMEWICADTPEGPLGHLNEVDVVTETALLRAAVSAALAGEAWIYPEDLPHDGAGWKKDRTDDRTST